MKGIEIMGGMDSTPFYNSPIEIKRVDFNRIKEIVSLNFGIRLTDEKKNMVAGRLRNQVRIKGFDNFKDYLDHLESDRTGRELSLLIDTISTNHTFFFREQSHFDFFFTKALPVIERRLKRNRSNDLRLWSAGCSGGDEAYTFIICLMEYFKTGYSQWNAGIFATDISEKMLKEARSGIYHQKRILQVPHDLVSRYFKRKDGEYFEVNDILKKEVTFRRLNLKNISMSFKSPFDVISCRNVMIYFDQDIKEQLVRTFYENTKKGGYLFIGHSETLNRKTSPYLFVQPGIYMKESGDES